MFLTQKIARYLLQLEIMYTWERMITLKPIKEMSNSCVNKQQTKIQ